MIKKLLSSQSHTITGAAIILGAASLASRLVGIVRDRIFAHLFGAGEAIDAYHAAFKIPDLIYVLLIGGALTVAFIPSFTRVYLKNKKRAWEFVNNIFNIFGIALVVLTLILIFLAPYLIPFIAPGFPEAKKELAVLMTRIMFLSPLFLGLSAVASGVLQGLKNFLVYSLSPIMYNIGIIFGAIFIVPLTGASGLAWGVALGALMHFLVQLPSLVKAGFRYSLIFNLKDKSLRLMSRLIGPRILALSALQINLLVITALASTLAAGSIAIFNYANDLQSVPYGLIGVSFALAAYPTLSELAAKNKKKEMIKNLSSTIRQILFFIIPLSVIFLLLRAQIVRLILGSGEFDWAATISTANTLAFFSLSLFAQSLLPLLTRGFFVLKDSKTPFFIAIISVAINIALCWYFIRPGSLWNLGIAGIALSYSISNILNFMLLWIFLRFKLGSLDEERILPAIYKMSIAALLMGLAIQACKTLIAPLVNMQTFGGIFVQGFTAGIIGSAIYVLTGLILKSHEMIVFVATVKKKVFRKSAIPQDISEIGEI